MENIKDLETKIALLQKDIEVINKSLKASKFTNARIHDRIDILNNKQNIISGGLIVASFALNIAFQFMPIS